MTRRGRAALIAVLLLVVSAIGTGGYLLVRNWGSDPADPAQVQPSIEPEPITTSVAVDSVTGKLDKAARATVKSTVADALDQWWDSAYLGGDWPRPADDFDESVFASFTQGAARDAVQDKAQMTNATFSEQISAVEAIKRRARIDVFAPGGTPVGVDVRFTLVFDVLGPDRTVNVNGTVTMTPGKADSWKIFDYRVRSSTRPLRTEPTASDDASASSGEES